MIPEKKILIQSSLKSIRRECKSIIRNKQSDHLDQCDWNYCNHHSSDLLPQKEKIKNESKPGQR